MFKFLTSKKGFTLVELMIVLLLLSLGVFALGNIILSTYRSFEKSEKRYIKQEEVKKVAELLRKGSASVCAAQTADIFKTSAVVPKGTSVDDSYSYLFAKEHKNEDGKLDGYYICVLDKGDQYSQAEQLSEEPMYISIKPYKDDTSGALKYYSGVKVEIAALDEDDYEYTKPPTSDDKFYKLDVAYHFPNMAVSEGGNTVNHQGGLLSSAVTYSDPSGAKMGTEFATSCTQNCGAHVVDDQTIYCGGSSSCDKSPCNCPNEAGLVLRVYCDSILGTDNTEAAIGVPSMCFIATASYGDDSGEVGMLCEFRDKYLLTNPLGTAFVNAYYKLSPPIADFIAENEVLKAAVRTALKPLVVVAECCLNEEIQTECIISAILFFASSITSTVVMMRVDKRRRKTINN